MVSANSYSGETVDEKVLKKNLRQLKITKEENAITETNKMQEILSPIQICEQSSTMTSF